MANDNSAIEWTGATWNPLVGCTKVSQGCKHCYAMTMAARIANAAQAAMRAGKALTDVQVAYREVVRWERGGMYAADENDKALSQWNNEIRLIPSLLDQPLRWKRGRLIFVNSMTDLFHEKVPFDYIDKVFAAMALATQHTFQVLTKRPERAAEYFQNLGFRETQIGVDASLLSGLDQFQWAEPIEDTKATWPLPLANVWLGTSTEDQKTADERIPHLLKCPAAVRFLSCEPLIGPVDLTTLNECLWDGGDGDGGLESTDCLRGIREQYDSVGHGQYELEGRIDWVIVGGESGHGARPMHPGWARSLRDQCLSAEVKFYFKQWGAWRLPRDGETYNTIHGRGGNPPAFLVARDGTVHCSQEGAYGAGDYTAEPMLLGSKHEAGRELDGRTWDEMPGEVCG